MSTTASSLLKDIPTPKTPVLNEGDPEAKREEILCYFHETYDTYEKLFEPLKVPDAYYQRADPLRHPLIFYYGHTAVFFINKLVLGKILKERINPRFESLLAIGVDEMSWDDLNEAHYDWPKVEEVKAYRQQVRETVDHLIRTLPLQMPIGWDSPFWIILMGIEHERIHLETSSVLIRQLPLSMVKPHPSWAIFPEDGEVPENKLLDVPGGIVRLGKSENARYYGWDNEYGRHEVEVAPFKASQYLVSNREFLKFIEAGGYHTPEYWTEEGWSWVQYSKVEHPRFWRRQADGSYRLRCMLEEIPMPWSWPVETNYLEAKAFCNWLAKTSGKPIRLPTEEEWYRLLDYTGIPDVGEWDGAPGNINLEVAASSVPVNRFGTKAGFYDVVGNVWQHTETPIAGFAGFKVHPLYDDFSTPTFDLKHNLIKGGSWISTGNEATRDSRYAFRRHFYQHAGFRYIESEAPVVINDDRYETDPDVVPFCEAHYGEDFPGCENYPKKLAQLCLERMGNRKRGRALELGCKVGRTSFELATAFEEVTGIDPTARTIRIGVEMVDKGYTQWTIPKEGEIVDFRQCSLKDLGLDATRPKVTFMQADLANMKELYRGYDLIVVNDLLDRSYDPEKFLASVHERLNPGGLLVIASVDDWHVDKTPRDRWLGGFKASNGENQTTLDGLQKVLGTHFTMEGEPINLHSVLRIHARRYDHRIVQVTFWGLKA